MALIEWSSELNLEIPQMDVEHQHLIALVNTLHDRFHRGQHGRALLPVFGELVEAARTHFEFEEGLLEKQDYPRLEEHKDEHRVLMDQLVELEGQLRGGKKTIDAGTFEFLCDWLVDHIVNADRDFAVYVRGVGVR